MAATNEPLQVFAPDEARRWLDVLCAGADPNPILEALDVVTYVPASLMLNAAASHHILAAAELVAAGQGRPSEHLPRTAIQWLVSQDLAFSPGIVALAGAAVRRVSEHSELRDRHGAAGTLPAWLRTLAELQARLQG